MTLIEFLIFVVVGCGVGFLAGLFGVGGGFVMVPILILSFEHSGVSPSVLTHMAIGTSLFVVIFASIMSAYQQYKQRNIDWQAVLILGFSSALIAFGTTRLASAMSGRHLRITFAIIVMASAIRMLVESQSQAEKKLELSSRPSQWGLLLTGVAAGVVSALAGIGGGLFTIPMMYNFLNIPLKLAIGTSSAAIVITAIFSVGGYIFHGIDHADLPGGWVLGFVDLQRGIALAIGSIFLARAGAYVSFKTHPSRLKKLFALFVIFISIYILVK